MDAPHDAKKMISAAVDHCLKERRWKQGYLEEETGLSQSFISNVLTGRREGRLSNLEKLAAAFGYDMASFLALGKSLLESDGGPGIRSGTEPGGSSAPDPRRVTLDDIKLAINHDASLLAPVLAHISQILDGSKGSAGRRRGDKKVRVMGT
jgi:transcriptional regulator with XRE-family HTH domain